MSGRWLTLGVSILAFAAATAQAQEAAAGKPAGDEATKGEPLEEIIVTGTMIRNTGPVGTNAIAVRREDVVASGAASANDLLAQIPQVGNFGTVPRAEGNYGLPIVRPNIRNLSAAGGSSTLVLLNGNRLVGAGILQTSVDPSIIPPDAIERVEIIPDGGSSIYGSDAIGGVINFITRDRFDGFSANARYGLADNYKTTDASLLGGKNWGSGGAWLSYSFAYHDNLLGLDRDYATANLTSKGGGDFRGTACSPGNILLNSIPYALPGRVPGTVNRCDQTDYADLYPQERRHSVFGGLEQELGPGVTLNATGYWSSRDTVTRTAQSSLSGTVSVLNPYFKPIGTELSHDVAISFDPVFGPSNVSKGYFESYGITPELKVDLSPGWQLRLIGNLGRSFNQTNEDLIDSTLATSALNGTTLATALNPYNPAASDPALLAAINNYENLGRATQQLAEARAVVDGPLFAIPGGDVRAAAVAEFHYEDIDSLIGSGPIGAPSSSSQSKADRTVKSVFGELNVPLVGAANRLPGIWAMELSSSVRHDEYDDVGGTTNSKVALNYRPVADLTLRANYGTSFHAPSLADMGNSVDSRVQVVLFSPNRQPTSPFTDLLRPTIVLAGGNPNLKPETADTYSMGFDYQPAFLEGLRASATYFNVKFKDAIGLAPVLQPQIYSDPNFASYYILNPTLAQALAKAGSLRIDGVPSLAALYAFSSPYVLFDARRNNLGAINTDGIDFDLDYHHRVDFGTISARVSGTYTLSRQTQAIHGGAFSDDLDNGTGRLALVASVGAQVGDLSGRVSWNHRGGYPIKGVVNQDHIDAFNTVDLFFSYDLSRLLASGVSVTLNVENLFDQDPPYYNAVPGYTNGSTLGRLASLGLRMSF
ncbi:TonB-dependent receptor domain-containing protein [Azospirillum sp. B4]|uniref:TonB-dependent receptor domain-containing protein n=1 Tax=Azospirillum sp. B4 TaxID=95605 RepID=UPI00034CD061|nr:TonB-dependent receptor [Azospirillum sp. B4]